MTLLSCNGSVFCTTTSIPKFGARAAELGDSSLGSVGFGNIFTCFILIVSCGSTKKNPVIRDVVHLEKKVTVEAGGTGTSLNVVVTAMVALAPGSPGSPGSPGGPCSP